MELPERVALPLLAKELAELSARRRTYVVRVVYASILLLVCWSILRSKVPWKVSTILDVLGCGSIVLRSVESLQNVGIQLVLPAIACGVFTVEKERNTLSLLFLTRLGPWTIVFEKFLSQLLLSINFLLISFPILAFGYALGGVTLDQLLSVQVGLFVSCVVVVSASLLCSAYFRTTSGALLGSYFLVFATRTVVTWMLVRGLAGPFFWIFLIPGMSGMVGAAALAPTGGGAFVAAAFAAIPWLGVSALYVLLTRWFLVRRAFLSPYNPLQVWLGRIDRMFERANRNSVTQGIVVIRPHESLPDLDPIAWRELNKRSLSQFRHLIRILVVLELPVVGVLLHSMLRADMARIHSFSIGVESVMWPALALITCVLSSGLICGERGRQTLEILLATPLHGSDIVQQKMAGISRLIWILEIPLWTCLLFRWIAGADIGLVICHVMMLLIYPRCIAWSSMWYGLTSKTTIVAAVKSLLMLLWKCLGLLLTGYLLFAVLGLWTLVDSGEFASEALAMLVHVSPLPLFVISEYSAHQRQFDLVPIGFRAGNAVMICLAIHGGLLILARTMCLSLAEKLLKRIPPAYSKTTFREARPGDPVTLFGWSLGKSASERSDVSSPPL